MSVSQLESPSVRVSEAEELEALRQQFVMSDDVIKGRLLIYMKKAVAHGAIDQQGVVALKPHVSGARNQIKAVLAIRAIAARLDDSSFSEKVTLANLEAATGLASNVISARCGELVKARDIEQVDRGVWTFRTDKIEKFLDSLATITA